MLILGQRKSNSDWSKTIHSALSIYNIDEDTKVLITLNETDWPKKMLKKYQVNRFYEMEIRFLQENCWFQSK